MQTWLARSTTTRRLAPFFCSAQLPLLDANYRSFLDNSQHRSAARDLISSSTCWPGVWRLKKWPIQSDFFLHGGGHAHLNATSFSRLRSARRLRRFLETDLKGLFGLDGFFFLSLYGEEERPWSNLARTYCTMFDGLTDGRPTKSTPDWVLS